VLKPRHEVVVITRLSVVVLPPLIGVTVNQLPSGAVSTGIGSTTYCSSGGAYYRPFYSGSNVIYQVVKDPNA